MKVSGYYSHAARSRRFVGLLLLLYVLAFELIAAFALALILLFADPENTILSNPLGYTVRYALPVAALSAFMFWRLYRNHAKAVGAMLQVKIVTSKDEPRFVNIAEMACTNLGVRFPKFGIIEAAEPNALTVGEGPSAGLMVATRGLLNRLDDDELAAVFAHEASHIRQGDTHILAVNHALMRTAVMWQVNNPLRIEDWRQLWLFIICPPMLLLVLASGATTMVALQLARYARRGVKLSRDHIADGEAIRVTHFPEALLSALRKVGGRGAFKGSTRLEGLLFDGPADIEGGSHPAIEERVSAVATLGDGLLDPQRQRKDTRPPSRPLFGQGLELQSSGGEELYPTDHDGRPLVQPPKPTFQRLLARFTNPEEFRQWREACYSWYEWRSSDHRNAFGIAPAMVIPVLMIGAFMAVFMWPQNNNWEEYAASLAPSKLVETRQLLTSDPFCSGPSYADGNCAGFDHSESQQKPTRAESSTPDVKNVMPEEPGLFATWFPRLLLIFAVLAVFKPSLLRHMRGLSD